MNGQWMLVFPLPCLLLLTAPPPLWWARIALRRRRTARRRAAYQCLGCGYPLHAMPAAPNCPECGRGVAAVSQRL